MSLLKYFHILLFIYSYVVLNCIIKWMFQRRRCCAFDSPGLPNDSVGYPGLAYSVWGTTPSVLRFFGVIRHKRFHYKRAFSEKAQHLWRWISLWMLTRGRLVPRQPRAIKRTTRTELHHEDIYIVKYIHWNIGINPTALQVENNHHERFIHWKLTAIFVALRGEDIYNSRYIYWKWGMNPTALQVENNHPERFIHCKLTAIFMALRGEDIYNSRYIYRKWDMNPTALHCNFTAD